MSDQRNGGTNVSSDTKSDPNENDTSPSPKANPWSCTFVDHNDAAEQVWRPWDEVEYPASEYPWGPGPLDCGSFIYDTSITHCKAADFVAVGCYDDYASDEPMLFCHRAEGKIGDVKLKDLRYLARSLERQRTPQDIEEKRTVGPMMMDGLCCHLVPPVPLDKITDDETWRVFHAFGAIMEGCEGKDGPEFDKEKEMPEDNGEDDELTAFLRNRPRTIDQYERKRMEEEAEKKAAEEAER